MNKTVLLTILFMGVSYSLIAQQCNLHPPGNLFTSDVTSCSAVLHWSPYSGASEYKVQYKLNTSAIWSLPVSAGLDTFFLFAGLEPGTNYQLAVRSVCSDGTKSSLIKKPATTKTCTLPLGTSLLPVSSSAVRVILETTCAPEIIYYRYGLVGMPFTLASASHTDSIFLTGLEENSYYRYQVSTCPLAENKWTPLKTFQFIPPPPNILVILLDDSRHDFYGCNGAPGFFQTAAIDRIASEGVNFKNHFAVYSLCAPSRVCMLTGMYPSRTGVISNISQPLLNPDLETLPDILHQNGYYTALIGKNHNIFSYDDGYFDYWLEAYSLNDKDSIKEYSYFGDSVQIAGYMTDVITDTAVKVIENTDAPFFIWMAYWATHDPPLASPLYDGLYDDEQMPLNADTAMYTENYPSFLYTLADRNYVAGDELKDLYADTYEVMQQVDDNIGHILQVLENSGKLDNTMIIFTSDNGHLFGEHGMNMKRLAYDPSIRIPLFIRYTKWFSPASVVTSQITLNIDLAPTILEAARITNTYGMDGISLRSLYDNQVSRKEMYYGTFYTSENQYYDLPYIKAVRNFKHKYIYYGCNSDTTEEFFDLINDPGEMNNLVNEPSLQNIIQGYRTKRLQYASVYGDTEADTTVDCYIYNPQPGRMNSNPVQKEDFSIYPNPSDGYITIRTPSAIDSKIEIKDITGQLVFTTSFSDQLHSVLLPGLTAGYYTVMVTTSGSRTVRKIIIQ